MVKGSDNFFNETVSLRIALIYAGFSALWILLSDQILFFFVKDPQLMTSVQMVKGWVFILISALIIFFLLKREVKKIHKAGLELKQSEEKYRRIFENSVVGLYQSTPAGRFTRVNPAFVRMLGYDSPEDLVSSIQDIAIQYYESVEDRQTFQRILEQNGRIDNFEFRAKKKDGSVIWVSNSTRAYFDDVGNVTSYEGIVTDITERLQAEEALVESEQRYRAIIEDNTEFIVRWRPDGVRTFANQSYIRYLDDYSPQVLSKNVYDSIHKDDAGNLKNMIASLTPDHPVARSVERKAFETGGVVWQEWTDRGIFNSEGRLIEIQSVGRDITSLKKAESEREEAEQRLRQAHKMESIGTLTGGIAHDFNNILGIIIGNAELALDNTESAMPAHQYVNEIKTASLRARDVVKQLLHFSRKTKVEQISLDVNMVARESMKLIRSSVPKHIKAAESIPDEKMIILGNATQIQQVVINLCTNAIHAMDETGGKLELSVDTCPYSAERERRFSGLGRGDFVQLSVVDSGPGIAEDIREKIFDPYFTTKETGKGTGMGLAVVQGIVKSHGGWIHLDSELGQGSIFRLFFPLTPGAADIETEPDKAPVHGAGETILFVDDEQAMADMSKETLETLGYRVAVYTDPLKALRAFKDDPDQIDLVLSDLSMPQMTGVQLAEKLKEIRPDVPVIICTGHIFLEEEQKAKSVGIEAYAMKPISRSRIAALIRQVL